jgi:hypothetical protein
VDLSDRDVSGWRWAYIHNVYRHILWKSEFFQAPEARPLQIGDNMHGKRSAASR